MRVSLRIFLISSVVIIGSFSETTSSVIVESLLGKLEGTISHSRKGREFHSFRGIPFAEKPERFQVSQLVRPWTGVKKAVEFGNVCPQFDSLTKDFIGNEDCLFLNVYTPVINGEPSGKEIPVMVWFNPGGFTVGKSDDFDPQFFMDEDVVLVTFNNRLGSLGFLDTGDNSVAGNIGLKDQVVALQWVQKTIRSFGGNSSKVTIFGCSAGAASVHFHMLSSMSKGLFRNAISQSGSALAPWSLQRNPLATAQFVAESLNCPTDTSNKLVDCLKTKSVEELLQAQNGVKWFMLPLNIFAPSIEWEQSKYPKFLESDPVSLISSGKFHHLPWMSGYTEDEGAFLSTPIIMSEKYLTEMNEDWSKVMPIALIYDHISNKELRDNVSNKIWTQYFGNEDISDETWSSLTHLFSDRFAIYPIHSAARLQAKFAPVYPFEFAFPGGGDSPLLKMMFNISGDYGVAHTDELQYQFSGAYGAVQHTNKFEHEIYSFSENFVKLWVSFASDNKPTALWGKELKWKPIPHDIGHKTIQCYQIAATTSLTNGAIKERIAFWDNLNVDNVEVLQKTNKKDEL